MAGAVTQISTQSDLQKINTNNAADYELTQDITINSLWTEIARFSGTFDGRDHCITVASVGIVSSQDIGFRLFGEQQGGVIKNLRLNVSGEYFIGDNVSTGPLVGTQTGGEILNVHVIADLTIKGNGESHGLTAGCVVGTGVNLFNVSSECTLEMGKRSISKTSVAAGGILGATSASGTRFEKLSSVFSLSGTEEALSAGGIAGILRCSILDCSVAVKELSYTLGSGGTPLSFGGIAGTIENESGVYPMILRSTVTFDTVSAVSVLSQAYVIGGLVGISNGATISECRAIFESVTLKSTYSGVIFGGLVARRVMSVLVITDSYVQFRKPVILEAPSGRFGGLVGETLPMESWRGPCQSTLERCYVYLDSLTVKVTTPAESSATALSDTEDTWYVGGFHGLFHIPDENPRVAYSFLLAKSISVNGITNGSVGGILGLARPWARGGIVGVFAKIESLHVDNADQVYVGAFYGYMMTSTPITSSYVIATLSITRVTSNACAFGYAEGGGQNINNTFIDIAASSQIALDGRSKLFLTQSANWDVGIKGADDFYKSGNEGVDTSNLPAHFHPRDSLVYTDNDKDTYPDASASAPVADCFAYEIGKLPRFKYFPSLNLDDYTSPEAATYLISDACVSENAPALCWNYAQVWDRSSAQQSGMHPRFIFEVDGLPECGPSEYLALNQTCVEGCPGLVNGKCRGSYSYTCTSGWVTYYPDGSNLTENEREWGEATPPCNLQSCANGAVACDVTTGEVTAACDSASGLCVCTGAHLYDYSKKTCESCSSDARCNACATFTTCGGCTPNHTLVSGVCEPACLSPDSDDKVEHCESCSVADGAVCETCEEGFFRKADGLSCFSCEENEKVDLDAGTCIACDPGYTPSEDRESCELSPDACLALGIAIENCAECDATNHLLCASCTDGHYVDTGSNTCMSCSDNCKTCESASVCQECTDESAFLLDIRTPGSVPCIAVDDCSITDYSEASEDADGHRTCALIPCDRESVFGSGCEECGNTGCTRCTDNVFLDLRTGSKTASKCIAVCPEDLSRPEEVAAGDVHCVDKGCVSIAKCTACGDSSSTWDLCTACSSGTLPAAGGTKCLSANVCKELLSGYQVLWCTACSTTDPTLCAACWSGNVPSADGRSCLRCENGCLGCTAGALDVCTSCADSYVLDWRQGRPSGPDLTGACIPEVSCVPSDGMYITGEPRACEKRPCDPYGAACELCTGDACIRCSQPEYLDLRPGATEGHCVGDCAGPLDKVRTDSQGGLHCSAKACASIPGCAACEAADESRCADCGGYAPDSAGKCAEKDACIKAGPHFIEGCLECSDADPVVCTSCGEGMTIQDAGKTCFLCPLGTYPSEDGSCTPRDCLTPPDRVELCTRCQENAPLLCAQCQGTTAPGAGGASCEGCAEDEVPNDDNSACVPIPRECLEGEAPVPHCAACRTTDPTLCRECASGYELSGLECIEQSCDSGSTRIEHCVTCHPEDKRLCSACGDGLTPSLALDQCVEPCLAILHCEACRPGAPALCNACSQGYLPSAGGDECSPACLSLAGCRACTLEDPEACSVCDPGMYVDGGVCGVCDASCETCATSTSCIRCAEGYARTSDGACVASCPPDTVQVPGSPEDLCASCDPLGRCSSCASASTCASCVSPYAVGGDGLCTACAVGFYQLSSTCLPCAPDCAACDDSDTCTACPSGQYLNTHTGRCQAACTDAGFWPGSRGGSQRTCSPCDPSLLCVTCSSASTCSACGPGQQLRKGTCELCKGDCSCLEGSVEVGNTCQACAAGCAVCSSPGTCDVCAAPLLLNEATKTCVERCPPGTLASNNVCKSCDASGACKSCKSLTECFECIEGHTLASGGCSGCAEGYRKADSRCEPCPRGCVRCTAAKCLSCAQGMYLRKDTGECVSTCSTPGFFANDAAQTCTPCNGVVDEAGSSSAFNCLLCASETKCAQCAGSLAVLDGRCATCRDGFRLEAGACEPCPRLCRRCDTSARYCDVCQEGALLNTSDRSCVHACYGSGFFPGTAVGSIYDQTLQQMVQADYKVCSLCDQSGNCDICASESACLVCREGYTTAHGSCTECARGYRYDNGCVPCPKNCAVCMVDPSSSSASGGAGVICLECLGNMLMVDGVCSGCADGYYLNGTCMSCNRARTQHCALCSYAETTSGGVLSCSACQPGWITSFEFCTLRDPNCRTSFLPLTFSTRCVLSPLATCASCPQDTYYLRGSCLPKCRTAHCEVCAADGSGCTQCMSGYVLQAGAKPSCVACSDTRCRLCPASTSVCARCEEGTLAQGKCVDCGVENCRICVENPESCDECAPGYRRYRAQALSLLDPPRYLCSPCAVEGCVFCPDGPGICEECAPGRFLQALGDQEWSLQTTACVECQVEHCLSCDGSPTQCGICEPGFYLAKDFQPGASAGDGIVVDASACLACPPGCTVCDYGVWCAGEALQGAELVCGYCEEQYMENDKSTLLADLNGASHWTCAMTSDPNSTMTIAGISALVVAVVCLLAGVIALLIYARKRPSGVWRSEVQAMADRDQTAYVLNRRAGVRSLTPAELQGPATRVRGEVFYPRRKIAAAAKPHGEEAGLESSGTAEIAEVHENNQPAIPGSGSGESSVGKQKASPRLFRKITSIFRAPTKSRLPRLSSTFRRPSGSPASRIAIRAPTWDFLSNPPVSIPSGPDSQLNGLSASSSDHPDHPDRPNCPSKPGAQEASPRTPQREQWDQELSEPLRLFSAMEVESLHRDDSLAKGSVRKPSSGVLALSGSLFAHLESAPAGGAASGGDGANSAKDGPERNGGEQREEGDNTADATRARGARRPKGAHGARGVRGARRGRAADSRQQVDSPGEQGQG